MTAKEYNNCVDVHSDGLYRFMLKNMHNEDDAKDVVQDVFTKLWERREMVNFGAAKSYLFTSAYHTMLDKFKKNKPVSIENNYYKEPNHSESYSDVKEILDKAVATLPEKQKAAITLRDYEGYSYEEIGAILNMNEAQVKVNIFRARKALKDFIGSISELI